MAAPTKQTVKASEWTVASLAQLGVAGVLVVVSLVLVYTSVRRWMLKHHLVWALHARDSNRPGAARSATEDALEWAPGHAPARELLATMMAEAGELEKAEAEYQRLIGTDYGRLENVYCGLGVVSLRRADRQKDAAAALSSVSEAEKHFQKAASIRSRMAEAEVGLKTCELLKALRSGAAPARFAEIAAGFRGLLDRLRNNPGAAREVTRGGFIDLYAGYARALYGAGPAPAELDAVAAATRSCEQYAPGWPLLRRNAIMLEARRFAHQEFTMEELVGMQTPLFTQRVDLKTLWTGQRNVYGDLEEAWMQFCLSVGYAYGRRNETGFYSTMTADIIDAPAYAARIEPALVDAAVRTRAVVEKLWKTTTDSDAAYALMDRAMERLGKLDGTSAPDRAAVLNNRACAADYRARMHPGGAGQYEVAIGLFKDAIAAEKTAGTPGGAYEAARNLAVVLKRRGREADAQEALDRALQAAGSRREESVKKDLEDVKAFFSGAGGAR